MKTVSITETQAKDLSELLHIFVTMRKLFSDRGSLNLQTINLRWNPHSIDLIIKDPVQDWPGKEGEIDEERG